MTEQKQTPEVFYKKGALKISQNLQENTCARVSFLVKLLTSGLHLYLKRNSGTGAFQRILRDFKNSIFYRTPLDGLLPVELFCENGKRLKVVNCFHKNASS